MRAAKIIYIILFKNRSIQSHGFIHETTKK